MSRPEIFAEIETERERQEELWGTQFDDQNTVNDWATFVSTYASSATRIGLAGPAQREQLMKTAALAVAALEGYDRNGGFRGRHYDGS